MSEQIELNQELFKKNALMAKMLFFACVQASESNRFATGDNKFFDNNFRSKSTNNDGWSCDVEFRINGVDVPFEASMKYISDCYNQDVRNEAEQLVIRMLNTQQQHLVDALKDV